MTLEDSKTMHREPDSEFVSWLNRFANSVGARLRCRWNPQRGRWVIDEANKETGLWQCILTWETENGMYADLNRDLAVRLELNAYKYNQLIQSPKDYFLALNTQAERQQNAAENYAFEETIYSMMQDKKGVREFHESILEAEHLKDKEIDRAYNRGRTVLMN